MIKKIKKIYMDISSSCNVLGLFEGLYVWCIRFTAQHLQNKKSPLSITHNYGHLPVSP